MRLRQNSIIITTMKRTMNMNTTMTMNTSMSMNMNMNMNTIITTIITKAERRKNTASARLSIIAVRRSTFISSTALCQQNGLKT